MGGNQGIDETLKVVRSLRDDVVQLMHIDWTKVGEEMKELDTTEKKELMIEIGSAVIQILASLKTGIGFFDKISPVIKIVTKLMK